MMRARSNILHQAGTRFGGLAAAALLGLAALAPLPAQAEATPAWQIDQAESRLGFEARQSGATFEGDFRSWQADIRFDPNSLAESSATVTVDMSSATTFAAERDGLIVASEWFDATTYPTATWTATSFSKSGANSYTAKGNLQMKGASHPVNLEFDLQIEGDKASVTGQAKLDRRDWRIGSGTWATDKIVGFEVNVIIELKAARLSNTREAQ